MHYSPTNRRRLCALISVLLPFSATQADTLQSSAKVETSITTSAANAQKSVSNSDDKARELEAQIEALQAEVNGLEVYQSHLEGMINNQNQELSSFDQQLAEIDTTRQSIVPLMYSMLDALEQSIANDKPIRIDARVKRVAKLKQMMPQADISDAEKYRRILEAYQIELDYGHKIAAYTATIETQSKVIETEQLYVGRAALVARSLDRQHYWSWDAATKQWQSLAKSQGLNIDKAFDVANKQAAPSLLTLPISLTAASEAK